jgi:membrane protease YdiL (CAAX protease family)
MGRSQLHILLFLAAVLALGAILAPPLYWGGKWLASMIVSFKQTDTPFIGWVGQKLTSHQFDSYFNRAFLISALGLLWPFLKLMKLAGDPLGMEKNPRRTADTVLGFVLAAGFLAVLTAALLGWGAYLMDGTVKWGSIIPRAILTGVIVALLEEWLFRGVFLGIALRTSRPWAAILAVSVLFSILHLVKAPDILLSGEGERARVNAVLKSADWPNHVDALRTRPEEGNWMIPPEFKAFAPTAISWTSGFEMTAAIFRKKSEPRLFFSEFLTLFAIGVILARARCATRSLWLPIGLHAGWIFANTLCLGMTKPSPLLESGGYQLAITGQQIPWIGHELKIGLLPLITLVVTAAAMELRLRRRG